MWKLLSTLTMAEINGSKVNHIFRLDSWEVLQWKTPAFKRYYLTHSHKGTTRSVSHLEGQKDLVDVSDLRCSCGEKLPTIAFIAALAFFQENEQNEANR